MKYPVIDKRTGRVVGTYSTIKRARTARDKKDNEYGGYCHAIRFVEVAAVAA